jgi:hypothetical protein
MIPVRQKRGFWSDCFLSDSTPPFYSLQTHRVPTLVQNVTIWTIELNVNELLLKITASPESGVQINGVERSMPSHVCSVDGCKQGWANEYY